MTLAVIRQTEPPPAKGELLGYIRTEPRPACFNIKGLRLLTRMGFPRLRLVEMREDENGR